MIPPVVIVEKGKPVTPTESVEFYEFRQWLKRSKYYTENEGKLKIVPVIYFICF